MKKNDIKEEPKFEVGKWYRFYWNWSDGYSIIAKVSGIGDSIHFNNFINLSQDWGLDETANSICLSEIENIEELSLEEIQQYLPDNHPDKIKPIGRWSVGSWVVAIKDCFLSKETKIGQLFEINDCKDYSYKLFREYGSTTFYISEPQRKANVDKYKWFPTKQEAQEFAKTLLEPKQLTINDLVEGEVYFDPNGNNPQWGSLFLKNENNFLHRLYVSDSYKGIRFCVNSIWSLDNCKKDGFRIATPQERKWLTVCIKQGKFIPQFELNKYNDEGDLIMDIPEYVELLDDGGYISNGSSGDVKVGEIYKLTKRNPIDYKYCYWLNDTIKFGFNDSHGKFDNFFKPSTKSAYDAQFKKDDEFKVGDWIYILDTGSSVNLVLDATNKIHYGANPGSITQITGITHKHGNASDKDPRYYGDNWNLRKKDFRLATQQEIDSVIKKDKQIEFKFNRWHKHTIDRGLWFIKNSNGDSYGFRGDGSKASLTWLDDNQVSDFKNMVLASDKEIEEALLNYAKKKYSVGIKFKSAYAPELPIREMNSHKYLEARIETHGQYSIATNNGEYVFYNGKWAEIVGECRAEPILSQDGYKQILLSSDEDEISLIIPKEVKQITNKISVE